MQQQQMTGTALTFTYLYDSMNLFYTAFVCGALSRSCPEEVIETIYV
jgi:hypothetical protein